MTTVPRSPIAVVGVSALFPGSLDVTGFWSDIMAGNDLITEVPPSHWLLEDYYDADPSVPDKTYANRGAFLKDVGFDAISWGIPPNIIPETDTSQLLALIVAQKVLDDASIGQDADRSRMSVILGVTSAQELMGTMVSRLQRPVWQKSLRDAGLPEDEVQSICDRISSEYNEWNESTFPGLLGNVVAGRIANRLNLGGTNCVTDAACASTFSALSMAVNELQLGDSDMVVAGGVDTMNDIFMFMCFSKTPALSPTGDCRPFSDQADGTMLGEGLGMVALKRLADAERDGDQIYAVINGVGASSDGRSKSVYAPVSEGQANALQRAYDIAGYGPDSVELIEAHGTGTIAGDAAEIGGLRIAFDATGRQDRQWCAVGSVKSQIGHTKAAAGAAGLVKTIMAINHKVLPPTIKVDTPSSELDLEASPFHLATRSRPWVRDGSHPRRASVSSFGFGGSNFHVAMSEYSGANRAKRLRSLDSELVTICGPSPEALLETVRGHMVHADRDGYAAWLARASQKAFKADAAVRLALVVSDGADLAAKLGQAADKISGDPTTPFSVPTGIHYASDRTEGDTAFLFSGQGSQYVDMGGAIAMAFPRAIDAWDAAAEVARQADWGDSLHSVVYPQNAFSDDERGRQAARVSATEWAQPAIGTVSLSMLSVLDSLGLEADCFGGHSFGEITALAAAGVIDTSDLAAVARTRGVLMRDAATIDGSMTAVSTDVDTVSQLLSAWDTDVVVANHNHPTQVVLSGSTEAIADVEGKLAGEGITSKRLAVATAFHSPIVSDAASKFGEYLGSVDFSKAAKPVYSNTSGKQHGKNVQKLVAEQLAKPVLFVDMIESMYNEGVRTFVEVGPGSIQAGLVGRILGDRPHVAVSLDRKGKPGLTGFLNGLAALSVAGHAMDFQGLWDSYREPENPLERVEPKLSIPVNGSNYGKPYPPAGGAAALPAPNPPRPVQAAPSEPVPATQQPEAAPTVQPEPTFAATNGMDAVQAQTADAHSAYLKLMAETHTAFLETMERGLSGLAAPNETTAASASVQLAPAPPTAPATLVAPVVPVVPVPSRAAAPEPGVAERSVDVPAAPVAPATPSPVVVPAVAAAPMAAVAAGVSFDGVLALMTQVVSEKTGYPTEMLELSMDLEGDLGIDSIKRVEILSEVTEREPALPELDTAVLADLRTLGEVVDYLAESLGASADAPAPVVAPAVAAAPPAPAPAGVSFDGVLALMTQVVSEKTGYPTEMLELSMDLEGDLGIDSIKRVEILSEVTEREPALPELDTAVLADLRTLGEVVDYLAESLGASADAPAPVVAPAVAAAPPAPAPAGVSFDGVLALMTQVVSEKTGYPTEMLELSMDLEGDLGIDSIKRVEILSEVTEREPALPELDTAVLADLRTLGEVVDYLAESLGASADAPAPVVAPAVASAAVAPVPPVPSPATPVPAPTAAVAPAANGAVSPDLFALLKDVVSEKTGYPTEMLAMEMDLEGDLGIDSIKRVEILSSVTDHEPNLPKLDTAVLADLHTLGEVVAYLESLTPQTVVADVPPPLPVAETSTVASAANGAVSPDLFALLKDVVSEKTGYPTEMLAMAMDLEGDLGIDSIKRVEILSSVTDHEPNLPKLDTAVLADLHTLGEVVAYLESLTPQTVVADVPPPLPVAETSTVASAANGAVSPDLFALLKDVVSEKTGYPTEMLAMEMDLEGDLGIDSIKRVEILSSVTDHEPNLPKLDTAVLADLHTLGEVVAYLESLTPGAAPTASGLPAPAVPTPPAVATAPAVGRYVLRRIEQPAIGMAMAGLASPVLVSEGPGQADLMEALGAVGITAESLDVDNIPADAQGLILLSSGSAHSDFATAKAVLPSLASGIVVTVQDTGGTFGSADLPSAWIGGMAGLARTINQEYPNLTVKAIDVDRADQGAAIAQEIVAGGPELNVGLTADGRRLVLADDDQPVRVGSSVLVDGDVVVASGGARGVTATTLIELAKTASLKFLLLGRTPIADEPACCVGVGTDAALKAALLAEAKATGEKLTPAALGKTVSGILAGREIRATLAAIADAGSEARYVPVSVTSHDEVQSAIGDARAWGPIAGLVHGAGVIADKALADKTPEQFAMVYDTKVDGLRTLLEATALDDLKAIVMFSSVAARTGNVGQCDYAMANEVLNKVAVAEAARRPGCVVKSFGWGPWEGGMVSPALKARFQELGVPLIPLDSGARVLVDELTDGALDEIELVIGGKPTDGPLLSDSPRSAVMEFVVGPETHPQIDDHAIDGVPVVPVVMALEWFTRAARAFAPGRVVSKVLDLEVVRGIMLDSTERLTLRVEEIDADRVALTLHIDDSLRYRATAVLADSFDASPVVAANGTLGPWGDDVVYDPSVLFHGPRFQMISSVDGFGESGISATLRPVSEMSWPNETWATDPVAYDGGLQAAVLYNGRRTGAASLPTHIGEVRFYAAGSASQEVVCHMMAKGSDGPKVSSDVQFVTDGVVTTEFIGLVTHLRSTPAPASA